MVETEKTCDNRTFKVIENQVAKVAVEYVKLCGLKNGEKLSDNQKAKLTQEEITAGLGVSVSTLNEMLAVDRKLTPEVKESSGMTPN